MALLKAPTLGKLLINVRNLLGQPNPTNSTWTDFELTEYLNEGVRMYFAEVVKNSEGWFTVVTFLDYTANVETIALPVDFFECKAMYIQRNTGWEILEYRNNISSGFLSNVGTGGTNTYSPYYYFQGNNVVIHPVPNQSSSGGAIRLDYVQFPDQMVNAGDTAGGTSLLNQVSPVFKQLLEAYAVNVAKVKQSMVNGTDLTAISSKRLGEIYAAFKIAINKRSDYPEYIIPFNPEGYE